MSDVRTVSNVSAGGASDEYVEQLRQKIGTGFSDQKMSGKKNRNELGKDDFMKLMSAQLKHQDPLSPLKNEQMAAQLAQFSALEQMVNVNQNLEKMAAAQKPQENVLAASLIGKKIMTDSSRFKFEKGMQPEVKFDLPNDAESVVISMVDAKGEVVKDFELANMAKGAQSIRWDGKNNKGLDVIPGEYSYKVSANAPGGAPMQINMSTAGLVTGVSFEGGKALLMVDGRKIPMEAVGRIEADSPATAQAAAPGANTLTSAAGADKQKKSSASAEEKTTQPAKNSLPPEISSEKMKNMLSALGESSRMEGDSGAQGVEEANLPDPLWNPQSL
jgi:flagellar basal-body rod modification protein FlgD